MNEKDKSGIGETVSLNNAQRQYILSQYSHMSQRQPLTLWLLLKASARTLQL